MKEAGAIVTDVHGTNNINSGLIIAANKKIQPKLTKILVKHLKK
jgi:myo-inositol-1(or 4)-monophosphatase